MPSRSEENSSPAQGGTSRRIYLTKHELVVCSGLSASTIQRYKEEHRIAFFQPGGKGARVLFPLDAVEAAVAQARQDGQEATARATHPSPTTANMTPTRRPKLPGPRPRWREQET